MLAGMTTIDPGVTIAHVNLKVADLDRALEFYTRVLGFEISGRLADDIAFLGAGGHPCHIALSTFDSRGGSAPPPDATGLDHVSLRYPSREALAAAVRRVLDHEIAITGASDHGVTEAVHLADPDGNGLELSWERPRDQWPRTAAGDLALVNLPLDLDQLLSAVTPGEPCGAPPAARAAV
jgi:catechol 2,3-dioxygenase